MYYKTVLGVNYKENYFADKPKNYEGFNATARIETKSRITANLEL